MASASQLAEEMLDSVNSGINPDELTSSLANGHRYLQANVFKQIIKPTICEFARQYEANNYDKRNESVLKECKEIADRRGWKY